MLSYDLTELLRAKFEKENRPPDGKLHPSGDLIGPLRHSMLRAAGAPTIESDIVSDTRLMTGTLWHSWFEGVFDRLPVMTEVKLDRYLPRGWSGTADWIMWSDAYKAFVLGDLKTQKGEGMAWVERDGIKQEHLWQLSSYWYALKAMGLPLVDAFVVYYLPMNAVSGSTLGPIMHEASPLDEGLVLETMTTRWEATEAYLESLPPNAKSWEGEADPAWWLTSLLAPEQERIQVVRWNKDQGVYDVKLEKHWSASFCPFPDELCACNTVGTTKIGHYEAQTIKVQGNDETFAVYVPRNGYAEIVPEVTLGATERKKLLA